jgi:large subunit ribosomal protein L19
MSNKIELFNQKQLKKTGEKLDIRPGDHVRINQSIQEKDKERIQTFEGMVIAKKHGKGVSSTITVRRVVSGVGVENIIPIHSPSIKKIEVIKRSKTRRAKLYYLRTAKGKKAKLKRKDLAEAIVFEEEKPEPPEEQEKDTSEKPNEEKAEDDNSSKKTVKKEVASENEVKTEDEKK